MATADGFLAFRDDFRIPFLWLVEALFDAPSLLFFLLFSFFLLLYTHLPILRSLASFPSHDP